MMRQKSYRSTLERSDYYCLLKRLSEFACIRKFPSPLYHALSQGARFGLNHVAVEDVIEGQTGLKTNLTYVINGARYRLETGPQTSAPEIPVHVFEELKNQKDKAIKSKKVLMLLKTNRVVASRNVIKGILESVGYTGNELSTKLREVMIFYRKQGLLEISKPVRILSEAGQDHLIQKIGEGEDDHNSLLALICLLTSARAGEVQVIQFFLGNKSFPTGFIPEGKTKKAKRWIPLGLFGSDDMLELFWRILERLPRSASDGTTRTFQCGATAAETSERLIRFLKQIGYGHLTAHSLRRQFVVIADSRIGPTPRPV